MKKLIEGWRVYKMIRANYNILKVVEDIFKFAQTTSNEGRPMMCKIGLLNTADGTKITDFISLWAGIGESNPIQRLEQIKNQKKLYEDLLIRVKSNYKLSDEDRKLIDMTIHYVNL